jgi:hypothetical protein
VKRALALLLAALGATACARAPSSSECDAMLDRYLDLNEDDDPALAGLDGEARAGVRQERVRERRASLAYLDAEKRCAGETTRAELACAMKAPSANDWEACFEVRALAW